MFKRFRIKKIGEKEKPPVIINHSERVVLNKSLNQRMMDELFGEMYGED